MTNQPESKFVRLSSAAGAFVFSLLAKAIGHLAYGLAWLTKKIFTSKHYALTAALIILAGVVVGSVKSSAQVDREEHRQETLERRNDDRRNDCKKIATRFVACYENGDDGACLSLHESQAWFNNEYGESYELSCPRSELDFTEAAVAS